MYVAFYDTELPTKTFFSNIGTITNVAQVSLSTLIRCSSQTITRIVLISKAIRIQLECEKVKSLITHIIVAC